MKKVLHRKIIHPADESFSHIKYDQFTVPIHSHEEVEVILITKGKGKQFVGNGVREYKAGDLTLIGSNLSHLNLCDSILKSEVEEKSSCEIIQFPLSILPKDLSQTQEYRNIQILIDRSKYGVSFKSKALIDKIQQLLFETGSAKGIDKIILILRMLDLMGKSSSFELISTLDYTIQSENTVGNEPLSKIYNYILKNFKKNISIQEIANFVGLNPTALCKFFKRQTGRTIFSYLIELRVEYACKLLSNSTLNISQIAFESGFNNLSHFNKQFREVTNQTPTDYKHSIQAEIV